MHAITPKPKNIKALVGFSSKAHYIFFLTSLRNYVM